MLRWEPNKDLTRLSLFSNSNRSIKTTSNINKLYLFNRPSQATCISTTFLSHLVLVNNNKLQSSRILLSIGI